MLIKILLCCFSEPWKLLSTPPLYFFCSFLPSCVVLFMFRAQPTLWQVWPTFSLSLPLHVSQICLIRPLCSNWNPAVHRLSDWSFAVTLAGLQHPDSLRLCLIEIWLLSSCLFFTHSVWLVMKWIFLVKSSQLLSLTLWQNSFISAALYDLRSPQPSVFCASFCHTGSQLLSFSIFL